VSSRSRDILEVYGIVLGIFLSAAQMTYLLQLAAFEKGQIKEGESYASLTE